MSSQKQTDFGKVKKAVVSFALVVSFILASGVGSTALVQAQGGYWGWGRRGEFRDWRAEMHEGYRDGYFRGQEDVRERRPFSLYYSFRFRNGSEAYREGFRRGYERGFQEYASYNSPRGPRFEPRRRF